MGGGVDAHMEKGWVQFLIGGVVFHRSTKGKGRKGEEHICLVFKTICTYNLAFKHVHGSLIRLFVSFDKNTSNCPEQVVYLWGVCCVCVRSKPRHQQPTSSCTKPLAHVSQFPSHSFSQQLVSSPTHLFMCTHTHNQRLLPAVLC